MLPSSHPDVDDLATLDVSRFLVGGVLGGWEAATDLRQDQQQGQVYRRPSAVSGSESEGDTVAATLGHQDVDWAGPVHPGFEEVNQSARMKARVPSPPPPPRRAASSRVESLDLIPPLVRDHAKAPLSLPPPPLPPSPNRRHYRSFNSLQHRLLHHLEVELARLETLLAELDSEIELEDRRERALNELHRDHSPHMRRRRGHEDRGYEQNAYGFPNSQAYMSQLLHRRSGLLAHIEVTMQRYSESVDSVRKWASLSSASASPEPEHDLVDILSISDTDTAINDQRRRQQQLLSATRSGRASIPFSLPLLTTFALTLAFLPSVLWRLGFLLALAVWLLVVVPLISPLRSWGVRTWHAQLLGLRRFEWLWTWAWV